MYPMPLLIKVSRCILLSSALLKQMLIQRAEADNRTIIMLNAVGQLKSDDAMEIQSRSNGRDEEEKPRCVKMTSKLR